MSPARTSEPQPGSPELLTIQPAGPRTPLFCVAPVLGTAVVYVHLARELGADQPLYGLQPPGVDGREPPLTSIEAMASRYVESIHQVQARGPYYLGGWSFGGIVAYELARQLAECGDEVALLAVIDTASPGTRQSMWSSIQFFATVGGPGLRFFLPEYLALRFGKRSPTRRAVARHLLRGDLSQNGVTPGLRALSNVFAASVWAGYHYEPRVFGGRLTLLRTAMPHHQLQADRTWGWNKLARGGVAIHIVPGRHMDVLRPPRVRSLAAALRDAIERSSSGDVQDSAHSF
jgi:thioesterase domain-containing protein